MSFKDKWESTRAGQSPKLHNAQERKSWFTEDEKRNMLAGCTSQTRNRVEEHMTTN